MYQKDRSILLRSSTSAVTKNLFVLSADLSEDFQLHVGVIHKHTINIVKPYAEHGTTGYKEIVCKEANGSNSTIMINQAKWCTIRGKTFLVIAFQKGIQIFDWNGSVLLFWHVFSCSSTEDQKSETFARGIAMCGKSLICVGTHSGEIMLFDVSGKETDISHVGCVQRDSSCAAIADLASSENMLVSADIHGIITVWKNSDNCLKQYLNITSKTDESCSVVSCWKNIIVAGYSNGVLRLYDLTEGFLIAEVTAHTRWISGLDIAPLSGLMCTCSEDSHIRVWELHAGKKPFISHKYSQRIDDTHLSGIAFCNANGNSFCTTGYDENELLFYRM